MVLLGTGFPDARPRPPTGADARLRLRQRHAVTAAAAAAAAPGDTPRGLLVQRRRRPHAGTAHGGDAVPPLYPDGRGTGRSAALRRRGHAGDARTGQVADGGFFFLF